MYFSNLKLLDFVKQSMVITKLHMRCEVVLKHDYIYDIFEFIYIIIFHENLKFQLVIGCLYNYN
jgi:hypothetical protein